MKKALCVLMLALLLPCAALAQVIRCDDFTMDLDPGMSRQIGEKAEGATVLQVFPAQQAADDDQTSLSVTWTGQALDLDAMTGLSLSMYGSSMLDSFRQGFEAAGLTVVDCSLLSIDMTQLGGKQAMRFDISSTVDYSAMGAEFTGVIRSVCQRSYVVPVPDGVYVFACVSPDAAVIDACIEPLLKTVQWN